MRKIWVNKASSFKEAQRFDRDYYLSLSGSERLEIMQFLREIYYKMKRGNDENRKGLRRTVRIVQLKSKKAAGRRQDEIDVEILRSTLRRKGTG